MTRYGGGEVVPGEGSESAVGRGVGQRSFGEVAAVGDFQSSCCSSRTAPTRRSTAGVVEDTPTLQRCLISLLTRVSRLVDQIAARCPLPFRASFLEVVDAEQRRLMVPSEDSLLRLYDVCPAQVRG